MRRRVPLILAFLLIALGGHAEGSVPWYFQPSVLDLSGVPPVFVREDLDLRGTLVKDDGNGPTFVLVGKRLDVLGIERPVGQEYGEGAPGIGGYGPFKYGTSHKDADESAVLCIGSFQLFAGHIRSNVCANVVPNYDGSYGVGSVVDVDRLEGFRFGVLAAGQRDPVYRIGSASMTVHPDEPAGHVFYGNRCTIGTLQLGLRNPVIRIGTVVSAGTGTLDCATVKAKSALGMDARVEDDRNGWGAGDFFDCSGKFFSRYTHPGTGRNALFTAFRVSSHPENPASDGTLSVTGFYDLSRADQTTYSALVQTRQVSFKNEFSFTALKGGGKVDRYWWAASLDGIVQTPLEIEK